MLLMRSRRVGLTALFLACCLTGCAQPPAGSSAGHRSASDAFAGSNAGEERSVNDIRLCWCPPGKFVMGSPPDEPEHRWDEVQADVTLSRGFWMGKYEVTQAQWK